MADAVHRRLLAGVTDISVFRLAGPPHTRQRAYEPAISGRAMACTER